MPITYYTHRTLSDIVGPPSAQDIADAINSAATTTWGSITGTLSNQTDLQASLNGKVGENAPITAGTNTKITYDAKGLVTAGAAATTADIADSTDARYVTDAQLVVIGNTSGTNTGDQPQMEYATNTLWVNGDRTDTYTENGSPAFPFKTIQGAINSISGSGPTNPFVVQVEAGVYTEDVTLAKPYVTISGDTTWGTVINGAFLVAPDGSPWNTTISEIGIASGSFTVHGNNTMGGNVPRIYVYDSRIAAPVTFTQDNSAGSLILYVFDVIFTGAMAIQNGTSVWFYDCHGTSQATTITDASAVQYYGGSTQSAISLSGANAYLSMSCIGRKAMETPFSVTGTDATQAITLDPISLGNCTLTAGPAVLTLIGQADATHAGSVSTTGQTFGGAKRVAEVALTSTGGSIAVDLNLANDFRHTTTEDTTLAAPTNAVAGQSGSIAITGGAIPRTMAFNTFWVFAGGTVPTLTATAGAVDMLVYRVLPGATTAFCQLLKDGKR